VVLKRGSAGAAAWIDGQLLESPPFSVPQVDPIGAGDAFAAGYLAAHLWGENPEERLRTANALGAICVREHGDYEGLPDRRELRDFLANRTDLGR
jgi:2-dehydro-3-deoxygluconokinase